MIKNANEIREAADIRKVVSQYVELKRDGSGLKGNCPFHNEKTPSFKVHEEKGIYKCFGCGQGGDAIDFIMEHDGLTYPEALEHVARMEGVMIQYGSGDRSQLIEQAKTEKDARDRYFAINAEILTQYRERFPMEATKDGERPVVDLDGRTFGAEVLERFGVVVAGPHSWIRKWAKDSKKPLQDLQALGLIQMFESGTRDRYKNRILFPIHDHRGNVAGFAGRKLKSDPHKKSAKYINSPESLAYDKGRILYGLRFAWRAIRDKKFAYLVEGYTDVLALHDNGIENVVCAGGTALTPWQAKKLAGHCDVVITLYDGDEGGAKATTRNMEILLEAGVTPSVCVLPPDEDPESFIRAVGLDAFRKFVDEHTTDAIMWRVTKDLEPKDPHNKATNIGLAARLLAKVKNDILRDEYLKKLNVSAYFGKSTKVMRDAIKAEQERKISRHRPQLKPAQVSDIHNYGLFVKNNRYYIAYDDKGTGKEAANFMIKPIMLIVGSQKSYRLVEITNDRNDRFISDIDSDDFVNLETFKKRVESRGYFIFKGDAKDFLKIKTKVYAESPQAFPIYTLGHHSQGFYTWGNGISVAGKFYPVNDHGIVSFEGDKYYLPAFSKMRELLKSDDEDNSFETHRDFIFAHGAQCVTFEDWSRRMASVYGDNGMIAVAYYLAALFRDLIFSRFRHFPHLNLFGPQGSGKSFLALSLMYMFGRARLAFDLNQGTNVGFYRVLSQARNALAFFDEYKNDIHPRRVAALKGAYDGSGHIKGVMSSDNRTVVTKVNSGCIIAGQDQPTKDIALFERCISLVFPERVYTEDEEQRARELKDLQNSLQLTHITQQVLAHREYIHANFDSKFLEVKAMIEQGTGASIASKARVKNNYTYLLTVAYLINEVMPLGFDLSKLTIFCADCVIRQSTAMFSEDECATFWRIFERLVDTGLLQPREHYRVEVLATVKVQTVATASEELTFSKPKRVLFLNYNTVHGLYQVHHRQQLNKMGLGADAMRIYLQYKDYFLGKSRAVRFGSSTRRALLFDMDCEDLGFDLQDTNKIDFDTEGEAPDNDDMPF